MGRKIFLTALILAASFGAGFARIINVPDDYATIQAGIDASADGDTVLVQPGTYRGRAGFSGHNITLGSLFLITDDTSYISSTIIAIDSVGAIVGFTDGEDSTAALIGFTIKHDGGSGTLASGIFCRGANPIISNNLITNNSSSHGGGIYCYHANPIIENNRIINNRAPFPENYGGGIYCEAANPIIRNNLIRGNFSCW
jgi:hypothetical protein